MYSITIIQRWNYRHLLYNYFVFHLRMMIKATRRNTNTRKRKEMRQVWPQMKRRNEKESPEARKLMILKLFWLEKKARRKERRATMRNCDTLSLLKKCLCISTTSLKMFSLKTTETQQPNTWWYVDVTNKLQNASHWFSMCYKHLPIHLPSLKSSEWPA